MITFRETAFRVWYIATFRQWRISPPDGFYDNGEFTYLTNAHPQFFRRQIDAWNVAKKNARKYRTLAILYKKNEKLKIVDYRSDKSEKI